MSSTEATAVRPAQPLHPDEPAAARGFCVRCRKTDRTCYCARIEPFESGPLFVILIHPKENRKRVGTGRLTHLAIAGSRLIEGIDFTHDKRLAQLLAEPGIFPVVLYPGATAIDVTHDCATALDAVVPAGKRLAVLIIDGSWSCAKKMLRVSENLMSFPQIRFMPQTASAYKIRRQPGAHCFSTVEAAHFLITELNAKARFRSQPGHDNLLTVFRHMIGQQLENVRTPAQRATRGERKPPPASVEASRR